MLCRRAGLRHLAGFGRPAVERAPCPEHWRPSEAAAAELWRWASSSASARGLRAAAPSASLRVGHAGVIRTAASGPDAPEQPQSKSAADPSRWQYRYTLRKRMEVAWKCNPYPDHDRIAAERAAAKLLRRPEKAAEHLAKLPEDMRRSIALSWAMTELEEEFAKADVDHDGKLSYKEFKQWAHKIIESGPQRDAVSAPSNTQLAVVSITAFVPFVGFGMVDNGLMVIYGDVIDGTLGTAFGFSMLASAALGNAISNIFGMLLHGTINKFANKLGLPDPHLTLAQRKLPRVHFFTTLGATLGVFIGCLLGMVPLLFMDQTGKEAERAAAKTTGGKEEAGVAA